MWQRIFFRWRSWEAYPIHATLRPAFCFIRSAENRVPSQLQTTHTHHNPHSWTLPNIKHHTEPVSCRYIHQCGKGIPSIYVYLYRSYMAGSIDHCPLEIHSKLLNMTSRPSRTSHCLSVHCLPLPPSILWCTRWNSFKCLLPGCMLNFLPFWPWYMLFSIPLWILLFFRLTPPNLEFSDPAQILESLSWPHLPANCIGYTSPCHHVLSINPSPCSSITVHSISYPAG